MMLRQKQPWGCGLYAVANACNLKDFVTEERLEKSKKGNLIGQLSKWMQDDGHPFYIDVLFYDHAGRVLPESALDYKPKGDGVSFLPVLINVRFSKNGKNHLVGGKIDKEGKLYLYDSLKKQMIETTMRDVNYMYEYVYGLFVFLGLEDGGYVFI